MYKFGKTYTKPTTGTTFSSAINRPQPINTSSALNDNNSNTNEIPPTSADSVSFSPSHLTVKQKIGFYEEISKQAKQIPLLPTKSYESKGFSKDYSKPDVTNAFLATSASASTLSQSQTQPQAVQENIKFKFGVPKYYHLVENKSEEELLKEFQILYASNVTLWDSVIDSTRYKPRHGNINILEHEVINENHQDLKELEDITKNLVNEINKMRQHPAAYAAVVHPDLRNLLMILCIDCLQENTCELWKVWKEFYQRYNF